jgi:hypothetical protein
LPLKARARDLGRAALAATRVGAVFLGCAVIVWSDDPSAWLGVGAALVGLIGGGAARFPGPLGLRVAACAALVVAARIAGGTAVAALVSVLLVLGWWLRLRAREVLAGIAVYGVTVAALGRASWQLLGAFCVLGSLAVAVQRGLVLVRQYLWSPQNLAGETVTAPSLDAESR